MLRLHIKTCSRILKSTGNFSEACTFVDICFEASTAEVLYNESFFSPPPETSTLLGLLWWAHHIYEKYNIWTIRVPVVQGFFRVRRAMLILDRCWFHIFFRVFRVDPILNDIEQRFFHGSDSVTEQPWNKMFIISLNNILLWKLVFVLYIRLNIEIM